MTNSTPSTEPRKVAIAISREELYVVMKLLKASYLPGFNLDWLNTEPNGSIPDDVQHALEVATNALIARGYLRLREPRGTEPLQATMPSAVISLVGTCIYGEDNVLLSLHKPEEPGVIYLHKLRQLAVVHTVPLPDIHQFEVLDGRAGMLSVINEVLGLQTQPQGGVPEGTANALDVQAARDAALAGNVREAVNLLVRSGLPVDTAQMLGKAMKEATALGAVLIARTAERGQVNKTTLAIVVSPISCFSLSEADSRHGYYLVRPISAAALQDWFASSLS